MCPPHYSSHLHPFTFKNLHHCCCCNSPHFILNRNSTFFDFLPALDRIMDSTSLLDYALFQLTPTRTRCDLVLFSGKKSEKIASGLLEPFLCHLKSAKDQISKGGYSIMLKPTSMDTPPWFTKAILERFVRFVSTPEVLERVVTIEREINQIESSNEQVNGVHGSSATDRDFRFPVASLKSKSETNGDDNAEAEENPKIRLHRVLESRKAMLKKEQAMAYARALVAGFEMDYIYDLVSFSDAFGALRLREACINFMELCNKKNNDTIWLDEVAAMQTIYSGENNELYQTGPAKSSASDSGEGTEFNLQQTERIAQSPTWQNNLPQYMQGSQGPMFQRHQSYPGYIYPGPSPHYPGPWPVGYHDPDMYLDRDIEDSRRYRSSNKKSLARRHSRKDEGGEMDQSSSGSESSEEQERGPVHDKKNRRKSSRKVVIRNINYIASAANDDSGGDSDSKNEARLDSKKSINESKVSMDVAISGTTDSKEESKGGNWDIFQNILMKDSHSSNEVTDTKNIQFQEEYSIGKPKHASNDFLLIGTPTENGGQRSNVNFEDGEVLLGAVQGTKDEHFSMPSRGGGGYSSQNARYGTESSVIKTSKEEDWIKTEISSNARGSMHHDVLHGEEISANNFRDGENKRRVLSDDSFMVQSRLSDGTLQSQPKADIFMASDIVGADQSENRMHGKVESQRFSEPEDLSMMLGKHSAALEMDNRNDISLYETVGNQSRTEPGDTIDATLLQNGKPSNMKSSKELGRKVAGKEPKSKAPNASLSRSKSDIPLRSKISTSGSTRGKAEKEEEKRKRMEELAIQRQKRIAERSAVKGTAQEISKVHTKEHKKKSPQTEKRKVQPTTVEKKASHKPVMKSSTIDRLATARTTNKKPSTESKVGQNRKPTSKMAPPLIKKAKETQEQKDKIDKKIGSNNSRSTSNDPGRDRKSATPVVLEDSRRTERTQTETKDGNKDFGTDTVLHTVTSVEKRESTTVSGEDASEEKNSVRILPEKDMVPFEDSSMPKEKQLNVATQITEHDPTAESNMKSALSNSNEKVAEKKRLSFSPEISVMKISTPPSDSEASAEHMQPRKKWNNGESSPKIPKGFRKLIFFGRRS